MVEISEVIDEPSSNPVESRSQERLADADEIEAALLTSIKRPSAKLHLQNLITKLRKEGKALQRVAASASAATETAESATESATTEPKSETISNVEEVAPAPKPADDAAPSIPPTNNKALPTTTSTTKKYQTFPTHYFDVGSYNSPLITIYIPLTNIGSHDKSQITCTFTSSSFDLIVSDFDGKSYRLVNTNLEKEIDVDKSKYVIKPNKIIVKLGKVKGEYGYDHWTDLTAKKTKAESKKSKDDPTAGIMDLMKEMYDSGDDNMKKMIGETMEKQRRGELGRDGAGMGGVGGMGMDDMGLGGI